PALSCIDVARRNSQEKTCSPAETLSVKSCPSGRTPRANDKWITLFGADIPCNITKTSERHERPLHMCFGCHTGCCHGRSGMLKHDGLGRVSEGARANPTGNISALSVTVYVARVLFRVGEHSAKSRTRRLFELHFLPMSSPLSCEDAENLMSQ
ncbi:uncharacterized protein N7487_008440, partial [Penicillium crustosum]|uniref:uncharacterized protein n=1 Tax=Penicillium crustosum TaxID=36656 RepID=UPI00238F88CC